MDKDKTKSEKTEKDKSDLKSRVLNKILELQGSSLDAKEQISTLTNFVQSLFNIETIAIYVNFANQEINQLSSTKGVKQYPHLGQIIESIGQQIDVTSPEYFSNLIPVSELNFKNLSDIDKKTYVYPIVSPVTKQVYGILLITNSQPTVSQEERRMLLFALNYIAKIVVEADLTFNVNAKEEKLKLISELSGALRGTLKSERAVEIVLKRIYDFLKLENIYFTRWIPLEKRLEIIQEIILNQKSTLKGFTHKVSAKNPIIKLLYKNQYMTYKNKNIRRISHVFLGNKIPPTFCAIPIVVRGELLGAIICIGKENEIEAKAEDLRLVLDIAGQLGVILNQSSLYEESLSTAQREFLLNSITTMIRDTLKVSEVLEKAAREVGQVFGVNACGAFIRKGEDKEFSEGYIWAAKEEYKSKLAALPINKNMNPFLPDPITQSIAIGDAKTFDFDEYNELVKTVELKSYLACSVFKGDKIVGVLLLGQFENQRLWTSSEIQLLEAITDQVEMALSQAELHEHLQQTERQMNLLHQVSNAIRDSLDLSNVMARAAEDLGEILLVSRCFIRRLKSVNPLIMLATEKEYLNKDQNINRAADLILEFEQKWLESLNNIPEIERANSVLHIKDVRERYKNVAEPLKSILEAIQIKSFLGIPLVAAGQVIGCLCIHQCDRTRTFTQNEIDFAKRVASEASVAVVNADLFAKVQHQAQRDGLTGLFNYAYFQTALHYEVERTKRTGSELSVIMIDLDHLKPINDKFGHEMGDEALKLVAGKMTQCLRQMDIVARTGGDEFMALLPETNVDTAEIIATRILDTLNRTVHPKWGPLSASIGVAGTPHEEKNKESILKIADTMCYVSKKNGRNRVTSSKKLDELGLVEKKPIDRG